MKAYLRKIAKVLLVVVIVAGCVYVLRPAHKSYTEQRQRVKQLEARIEMLEAERARLEEQMLALQQGDPECIERQAREKLHLIKPGEVIFRFKEE